MINCCRHLKTQSFPFLRRRWLNPALISNRHWCQVMWREIVAWMCVGRRWCPISFCKNEYRSVGRCGEWKGFDLRFHYCHCPLMRYGLSELKETIQAGVLALVGTTASNRHTLGPLPPWFTATQWGNSESKILDDLIFRSDCNRPAVSPHSTHHKYEILQIETVPGGVVRKATIYSEKEQTF